MDFALQGDGFFQIQSAEGKTMLTRNGSFFVNKDGFLVTNEGHKVLNDGGTPIQFAQDDYLKNMDVTLDGTIRLRENNTAFYSTKTIAKLKIAEVKDKSQLVRLSANYFATPAGAPPPEQSPAAKYKVNNNFLEEPNTSVVKEMVTMIDSQRQFEIGQRMIKSLTETYQSELRKLASG
jgi:flagellar basal body rod protein FlgG